MLSVKVVLIEEIKVLKGDPIPISIGILDAFSFKPPNYSSLFGGSKLMDLRFLFIPQLQTRSREEWMVVQFRVYGIDLPSFI